MRTYKIVKKEDKPTITINKVNFNEGFVLVESSNEAVGIIVLDDNARLYSFISNFKDSFRAGIIPAYCAQSLEELMNFINNNFVDEAEFTFIRIAE